MTDHINTLKTAETSGASPPLTAIVSREMFEAYGNAMRAVKTAHGPHNKTLYPEEYAAYLAAREKARAEVLGDLYQPGISIHLATTKTKTKKKVKTPPLKLVVSADFTASRATERVAQLAAECAARDAAKAAKPVKGAKPPVRQTLSVSIPPKSDAVRRRGKAHQPYAQGQGAGRASKDYVRNPWQHQQGLITEFEALELEHVAPTLTIRRVL